MPAVNQHAADPSRKIAPGRDVEELARVIAELSADRSNRGRKSFLGSSEDGPQGEPDRKRSLLDRGCTFETDQEGACDGNNPFYLQHIAYLFLYLFVPLYLPGTFCPPGTFLDGSMVSLLNALGLMIGVLLPPAVSLILVLLWAPRNVSLQDPTLDALGEHRIGAKSRLGVDGQSIAAFAVNPAPFRKLSWFPAGRDLVRGDFDRQPVRIGDAQRSGSRPIANI